MGNDYEIKIKNHKRFNNDDIKNFCIIQAKKLNLDDYVVDLLLEKVLFGLASYNEELKSVCLIADFIKDYKAYKKQLQSKNILDRILLLDADAFNLFIIVTMFHELSHANQKKEKNENPNSDYSVLIKASYLFMPKSGSTYDHFHNRFYHEYDAIINSMQFTLDYIKDFDIDERALFLLNKSFSTEILNAYGINLKEGSRSDYKSPVDFFKYFFDNDFYISDDEKSIIDNLESSIASYQPNDDFVALLHGYPISDSFIEKLIAIASGKANTTNLLAELSSIEKKVMEKD